MTDGPGQLGGLTPPQATADLEIELRSARQQIRRLQGLVHDQADQLERRLAATERISALADLAEWAQQSAAADQPAYLLVSDLRRAMAVEASGSSAAS